MKEDEQQPDDFRDAIAWTESLVVRSSPIHGLGVFARRPFNVGEIIERVPLIPIPQAEMHYARMEGTFMHRHLMPNAPVPGLSAWMNGFGTLYNHTPAESGPNAQWAAVDERLMVFRAIRRIAPGDEITYDYGEDTGF